jgi:hypothetical protein
LTTGASYSQEAAIDKIGSRALEVLHGRAEFLAPQERRCNPAVYTSHDAGQIVDQTAPFARLTTQVRYPEQYSRRTYVWNPKVTTAAPAYIPTRNIAQRGRGLMPPRASCIGSALAGLRFISLDQRDNIFDRSRLVSGRCDCAPCGFSRNYTRRNRARPRVLL